jgi:excinuclease ABC subunit C
LKRRERHERIVAAVRVSVPETTGVYLFIDKNGGVVYVGKSVRLKSRMLSYFRDKSVAAHPRLERMIRGLNDFGYRTTETELQALLLEDELIKTKKPVFNVRQNEYEEYRYLLLTHDDYPALKTVWSGESHAGKALFGPFRDRFFVQSLLELIHKYLHIRACTGSVPGGKSLYYDLGLCRGLCRDKISTSEYAGLVRDTSGFLEGHCDTIIERIERDMDQAVRDRAFEKAAIFRDKIEFCRRFCARQLFTHRFSSEKLTVLDTIHADIPHVFVKGYAEQGRNENAQGANRGDGRFILDRANIIYSWINRNKDRCEYRFEAA